MATLPTAVHGPAMAPYIIDGWPFRASIEWSGLGPIFCKGSKWAASHAWAWLTFWAATSKNLYASLKI